MDIVTCVAGVFIVLGLVCALATEWVAELGVRLDFTNQASAREILKRYAGATHWTGRIVGGIFVIAGLLILLAGRP
jgi:threonine/homoserine/homoserine lactone efflux protein